MFTFKTHFGENKFGSIKIAFHIDFAMVFLLGPYAFLVGLYALFRPCHFDTHGPYTGLFLLWFSKEIARGAVWVI